MTPKTKALELIDKYYLQNDLLYDFLSFIQAKECALIVVNEIMNISKIASLRRDDFYMELEFYQEVKEEIIKL